MPRKADPTRDRLISTALEQFALHGVGAVSLRTITAASGAANQSAVHYHFNNKAGLINAILAHVNDQLAPLQAEALAELEEIAAQRTPTVREIVAIGFSPFIALFAQSRDGRMAMRLFSRMTWEGGKAGQGLLVKSVRPYFLKLEPYFQRALPNKPLEALRIHAYLAVNNLVHGLPDMTLLGQDSQYGLQELVEKRPDILQRYFFDYISAGISSAVDG